MTLCKSSARAAAFRSGGLSAPGRSAGQQLDAAVLAWILRHDTLTTIIRAIDDPDARADVEHWGDSPETGQFATGRHDSQWRAAFWERRGLRVEEWPERAPWVITWDRVIGAVTAAATPTHRRSYLAAVADQEAHESTSRAVHLSKDEPRIEAWRTENKRRWDCIYTEFAGCLGPAEWLS